jgi:nitrate reductase (NAD(P)H)
MDELVNEFPAVEVPVTLVCAGNRRKEQNMVQQTVGFNWGAAGVSTSVWRGASLRDVLRRCGIMGSKGRALHVSFEGAEDLPGGGGSKYGTSITREWALDQSRDIILAYMQNGEPLLPDHGFPVRVIIPGCIGGRMVKWVKRIIVTPAESDNYYHFKDNRVLPSHVDAELANAEAWWYKPEHIINELNTNSVITTPGHDEILPINAFTTQRAYTMKGYAYSGGGKKITRVEVTLDGGETWLICKLDIPEKPNKYGRYWCWCFWSVEIEVLDLLGAKEVAVRAWDQTHNTQPEKLIWNLMGMMNNCWFKVKVNVCRPHKGEIGLVFEHPTQPGNQTGGWMARQKHLETAEAAAPGLKRSTSTPFLQTAGDKQFTMSEVRKHGSKDSAWIVVHGHVYDCTAFLKDHPGGADSILINAGSDCTEEFDAIHSDKAKALLDTYRIGELITTGTGYNSDNSVHGGSNLNHLAPIREATKAAAPIALSSPREKIPCRLVDKKELSHDVRLFRFALPSSDQVLGLPVGKHIFVCATIEGKLCMRAYTPTSVVDEIGQFELLIKVYYKNEHPKFPNGGLMTQYLESLQIGSYIDVKGPLGHVEYTGRGNFVINGKQRHARRLAMICGGSGITPMYQVIQAVLRDQPEDETEMHLVYANRTEDDILLRDELDRWAAEYPDRLKVWYVIDQVKRPEDGWKFSVGFVSEDILRAHVPEGADDTLALACGPPPMIKFAISPNLEKMKYDMANSFISF